jgi:hypothetical protein
MTVHSILAIGTSGQLSALPPKFRILSWCRRTTPRAATSVRHDHHPADAEAVDRHAETPHEERLAEWHRGAIDSSSIWRATADEDGHYWFAAAL